MAYFKNGYVYHTKFDDIQQISLGTVQRAGDNLLALVSRLASIEWPSERDPKDTVVFFDYLGLFMISFSNVTWHLVNIALIGLAFYQTVCWVMTTIDRGTSQQVVYSCLASLGQMVGAFLAALLVVGLLTLTGRTMSWYSRPYLLLGLYGLPALATAFFIGVQVSDAQQRTLKSTFLAERVQFEGVKLNLTLILVLTYMYGLRSNVMLMPWIASAILGRWILDKLYQGKRMGKQKDDSTLSLNNQ